jgi:transposase
MTVARETEAEIRRLYYAEHWRMGTIATQLGVHADVVRRVLGSVGGRRTIARPRLIDPFLPFVMETLEQYPRLRASRLYDMLRARGYQGSLRTLREQVRAVRPRPRREAFLRTEPLRGEQAQVDWAYVGKVPVPGGERRLWLFVLELRYSRAMWGELVFDMSADGLCRSLTRAAVFFGGMPRQWLFDNPKTIVLEQRGASARFHPALAELCGQMHVQPRLCAVARPQHKGGVERAIRYLRDRFLAARHITSIEQGNRELLMFLSEIAYPRPHPRQPGRTVAEVLAEEQAHLLPVPDPLPATDTVKPVRVDKTAFVRLDTNAYSVPHTHAGQTLTLVCDDRLVRLLDGASEVARHARRWGLRQIIEDPAHREALLAERRRARDLKGRDRLRAHIPMIDHLLASWLDAGHVLSAQVVRIGKLLDLYGADVVAGAVDEMLARGLRDPGALAVACEQRRRALRRPVPVPVTLPDHVDDREVVPHALESYDE